MSSKLKKIAEALKAISLEKLVNESILASKESLLKANKDQLFKGRDSEGGDITPLYTPYTKRVKAKKGQPFDRVTLKDTGDFYANFDLSNKGGYWEFSSTDVKKDKLVKKYGKNIFGVEKTSQSFEDLRKSIIEKIQERIYKANA